MKLEKYENVAEQERDEIKGLMRMDGSEPAKDYVDVLLQNARFYLSTAVHEQLAAEVATHFGDSSSFDFSELKRFLANKVAELYAAQLEGALAEQDKEAIIDLMYFDRTSPAEDYVNVLLKNAGFDLSNAFIKQLEAEVATHFGESSIFDFSELKRFLANKAAELYTAKLKGQLCKYHNKKVQFHWLDYGMNWDDTRIQVIPPGIDKHKLDTDGTYRDEVTTMIQNSLVRPLLHTVEPQETAILTVGLPTYTYDLKTRPCRYLDEEDCLGYRNQEFPGGTCVFDNKGVEYQNEDKWYSLDSMPKKCRSVYDYIHHELRKPKCDGFQMPTKEMLAKWFVSEIPDTSFQIQNFTIIRCIMEVYTLLRMFRQFTEPAKRCIVYAGELHSRGLVKLLVDTQGYVILDEKKSPENDAAAQANYAAAQKVANEFSDQVNNMTPDELVRDQQLITLQMEQLYDNIMQAKAQVDKSCRRWSI